MIEDKKIVITGGAGFVGSNLAHKLIGKKNEVLLIDNLSNSITDISSISNNLSIGNSEDIDKICNNAKFNPDLVFHLGNIQGLKQVLKILTKYWKIIAAASREF